jgi:cation diffusion facilitator family transporter
MPGFVRLGAALPRLLSSGHAFPIRRGGPRPYISSPPPRLLTLSSKRMPGAARVPASDAEESIGRRIALISMSAGVLLAVAKIWVGLAVGSTAVASDGLEAAADVLSSAVVYAGFWLASRPPDYEHPYGHGRYETLAGLAVGAMLLLAGAAIVWHSAIEGASSRQFPLFTLYPLIAAVALKIGLATVKFRTAKRIGSASLYADGIHDLTDLFSTCVAIIAVGLTLAFPGRFLHADQTGGLIIGLIVFFLSVRVVWNTVRQLLDTMPEPRLMGEIRKVALDVPGALGIEKCFARRTGLKYHVDLHLEVDPEMTVRASHQIATQVKNAIKDGLPWVADVLVHVEPVGMSTAPSRAPLRHANRK